MKLRRTILRVGPGLLLALAGAQFTGGIALADTPPNLAVPAGLSLAEVKITGDEFVMLMNNTSAAINDLSSYWLYGFNSSDPTAPGVSSSSQQLPVAALGAGQTILLSDNGGPTCGAAVTGKLSIALSDSSGYLEVVHQGWSDGLLATTASDAVSWTDSSTPYSSGNIITPSVSADKAGYASYRYQESTSPPAFWWEPAELDSSDSCQLDVTPAGSNIPQPGPTNPGNQLLPGTPPPATVLSPPGSSSSGPSLPAGDAGLMAPELNELLPNPASPQTDADDEFIELYNPNSASFDLSGFQLQTGSATSGTRHTYTLPDGTSLAAKSFKAFYSSQTNLSMSNGGGQAWLLDPFGNSISQTEAYGTAKDGEAWALANDSWQWTDSPTPNAANVIAGSSGASKSSSSGSTGAVKGTSTTGSTNTANTTADDTTDTADLQPTPIHPAVLALVAGLALLYGAYEYRHDVANRFHQFKRYRARRREARAKS